MKNNNFYSFITYGLLTLLIIFIFSLTFKYKFKTAQNLSFRSLTNKNSLKENYQNSVENHNNININGQEGFTLREGLSIKNSSKVDNDNVFKIIDNKLKGLVEELGGDEGKNETKKILTNTKKICDLECAKCMMTMINDKKSLKTIDLENIMNDETDDNCIKCKKYTELSTSIQSIVNNL